MKKMKLTALLLASLLLGLSMFSCSENKSNETDPEETPAIESSSDSSDSSGSKETVEEDTGTHYYDEIEAVNYDGWTLGIASRPLQPTYWNNITVQEVTGDEFIDALFNRQRAIEDKFNIVINETYHDGDASVSGVIQKNVRAGLDDYSLGYRCYLGAMPMFTGGDCMALSDLPIVDLTKPYWDQSAQEELTINGKMYYAVGDIGVDQYESSVVIFYNGVLLGNNQINESPYDLYKEGKWTVDAMKEMMQIVSHDTNGDGAMEAGVDIIGFNGRTSSYLPIVVSSGLSIFDYDDDTQSCIIRIDDEQIVSIGNKIKEVFFDASISGSEVTGGSSGIDSRTQFKNGTLLFYSCLLGDFRLLRENEDDYGIITWPSYQENVVGKVYTENPTTLMVAASCKDMDRLGTILEALASYTYDNVLSDYINRAVIGKGARDKQSAEVVRESMNRRYYDPADAFNVDSVNGAWERAYSKDMYASVQKICEKSITNAMKRVVDSLD